MHKKCIHITKNEDEIHIEAIYEDTMPNGSNIGTVVGFHGAPGSNRDFKYIRETLDLLEIRFIGINYPGFGVTKSYENQQFTNDERQLFTNALLEKLELTGKVIFLAHSRGCENALISVIEKHKSSSMTIVGLVLVAPTGLRPHKAVSSNWTLTALDTMSSYLPSFARDALLINTFNTIGLRVASGEIAHASVKCSITLDFDKLLPYIDKFNDSPTRLLVFYGGKDQIVEKDIITEYISHYKDLASFNFDNDLFDEHFYDVMAAISQHKSVSVLVESDNHYQNKNRATLIARSIRTMFSVYGSSCE